MKSFDKKNACTAAKILTATCIHFNSITITSFQKLYFCVVCYRYGLYNARHIRSFKVMQRCLDYRSLHLHIMRLTCVGAHGHGRSYCPGRALLLAYRRKSRYDTGTRTAERWHVPQPAVSNTTSAPSSLKSWATSGPITFVNVSISPPPPMKPAFTSQNFLMTPAFSSSCIR